MADGGGDKNIEHIVINQPGIGPGHPLYKTGGPIDYGDASTQVIDPNQIQGYQSTTDLMNQGVQPPAISNIVQSSDGNTNIPQVTVQDFGSDYYPSYATGYTPLGQDPNIAALDDQIAAAYGQTSPGAMNPRTYIPGLGQSTAVGGYSGSMIGSTTLFAPTGRIVPLGMIDAREKALQDAAAKAADLKAQKAAAEAQMNAWVMPEPNKLADKNYQGAFNKEFNQFHNETVEEAKRLYGKDWARALKDPTTDIGRDYQQKLAQFEYIQTRGDQMTNMLADIMDKNEKGQLWLSPQTKKLANDAYNRIGDWKNADITDLIGIEGQIKKAIGLDKYFKDTGMLSQYMYQIDEEIKRGAGSLSSDQWNTYRTETIEPKAREMAKVLTSQGGYFAGGPYTEEDIYNNIMSRYADRNTVKAQFQGATERAKDYYKKKDMNNPIIVQGTDFGTDAENVIPLDNDSETGVTYTWTDADGNKKQISGNETVTYNSIQNHLTPSPDGTMKMNPFVYVTVTGKNEDGKAYSRQEALPFNEGSVKARMYSGKYSKAAELTDKVNNDWNTGSYTVAYDKDGVTLNEYQKRSEDKVKKIKGKTQISKNNTVETESGNTYE